jgi:hypothetical protein
VAAAGSSIFTILLSFINQHLLTTYGVRDTDRAEIKIETKGLTETVLDSDG